MRLAALRAECVDKLNKLKTENTFDDNVYLQALKLRKNVNMYSNPKLVAKYTDIMYKCSQVRDLERTIEIIDHQVSPIQDLYVETESGVDASTMKDGLVDNYKVVENVGDMTGEQEVVTDAHSTVYSVQGQRNLLTLDNFFQRPIQIAAGKLLNGTFSSIILPVWDLYTLNPAVRAKLRNYAFLKANLHVKIMVSGTPYHYGKLMISYQPYAQRNQNLIDLNAQYALSTGFRPNMISYLSQAPGAHSLDIRENKPVHVVCPFISTKNAHRLYNTSSSVISDVTSYEDLKEAGDLYVWSINAANVINALTDPARYYVYAWLEDVELGPPTGTQVDVRTESALVDVDYVIQHYHIRTEADERDVGPIEKFSSGAKRVSSMLSVIPEIAPFAQASSIAFGALESVASIFGWARPVIIDTPVYVKNLAWQNGANTIGSETNMRLTLDPKQELTVDPRICGTDSDDMTFKYLASIPAYITTFGWIPDDVPMTPLFRSGVSPTISAGAIYNGYNYIQQSPMAFVSHFFESWRGDIEFTFEIVCSQFHRGKLAVIYEPNLNQEVLINGTLDLNKQYVKIIDIQETQTVTFKVNWASTRSWLNVRSRSLTNTQQYTGTGAPLFLGENLDSNGYIVVVPITDLISPDNGTVEINVYAKCPNLMVNGFQEIDLPENRDTITESVEVEIDYDVEQPRLIGFYTEADQDVYVESGAVDDNFYSTQPVQLMDLNESVADTDVITLEHYGELPVSFRSLLKRYTTASQTSNSVVGASVTRALVRTLWNIPTITLQYSSTTTFTQRRHLIGELRYAYLGMRGGVRHRVMIHGEDALVPHAPVNVNMRLQNTSDLNSLSGANLVTSSGYLNFVSRYTGAAPQDLYSNGGFEVEIPYYSRNKFTFAFANDGVGSNPGGSQNMTGTWRRNTDYVFLVPPAASNVAYYVTNDCATGEDFTFLRFQGAPHFRAAGALP